MWPFKRKDTQKLLSVIFIIMGLLLMTVKPISEAVDSIGLNSFIIGMIIAFVGLFYFMDVQ